MSNETITFSHEEWIEFRQRYSTMKHTLNNALAVFMALAELAQRNSENYEKLAKSVCSRAPEIAAMVQDFSVYLDTKGPVPPLR